MTTPYGFAAVSVGLKHASSPRESAVTFGVATSSTDPVVVAATAATFFTGSGAWRTQLDSNVTITQVTASLGVSGGPDVVGVSIINLAGTATQTSASVNNALLVSKRTALGGRKGRGRMFIPWVLTFMDADEVGVITSSRVTALQTVANTSLGLLTTASMPMALLHKSPHGIPPAPGTIVSSMQVNGLVSSQRRRLGR